MDPDGFAPLLRALFARLREIPDPAPYRGALARLVARDVDWWKEEGTVPPFTELHAEMASLAP